MPLVVLFVLAVLAVAAGAIVGAGPLAGGGLFLAAAAGFLILWQLAARRPPVETDLPERKCPNGACGQKAAADAVFCPRCGHRLAAEAGERASAGC
jgi:hypothetical protein